MINILIRKVFHFLQERCMVTIYNFFWKMIDLRQDWCMPLSDNLFHHIITLQSLLYKDLYEIWVKVESWREFLLSLHSVCLKINAQTSYGLNSLPAVEHSPFNPIVSKAHLSILGIDGSHDYLGWVIMHAYSFWIAFVHYACI